MVPPDGLTSPPTPPRRETGAELPPFRTGAEVRGAALPDVWPGAPSHGLPSIVTVIFLGAVMRSPRFEV